MRDALRGVWACHVRCTRDCSLEMPRKRVVSNSVNADSRRAPRYRLCAPSPASQSTPTSPAGKKVSAGDSCAFRSRTAHSVTIRRVSVWSLWTVPSLSRRGPPATDHFAPSPRTPRVQDLDDRRRERPSRRSRGRNPRANPPPRARTRRARQSERLLREIKFRLAVGGAVSERAPRHAQEAQGRG